MKIPIIEGLSNDKFQSYDKDPLILTQQNAGNIKYLKNRFTEVDKSIQEISQQNIDVNTELADMQEQIKTNTESIYALLQEKKNSTDQLNNIKV
jgi:predicted transcriptional regulator